MTSMYDQMRPLPLVPFRVLTGVTAGLLLISLAAPLYSGADSAFEAGGGEVFGVYLLIAGPMVLGAVLADKHAIWSGIAAGACLFYAWIVAVLWIAHLIVVAFVDIPVSIGSGGVANIASGATAVASVVIGTRFQERGRELAPAARTTSLLGVVAVALTTLGLLIPPDGQEFDDTFGFSTHPALGLFVVVTLLMFFAVGYWSFQGGIWGVGLLAGVLFIIVIANVMADESGATAIFGSSSYHPLAVVGFWATVVLLVVHFVQLLNPSVRGLGAATPAGRRKQWAPDPFGRFELRYHDGRRWTEHVATGGAVGRDAPVAADPQQSVDRRPSVDAQPAVDPTAVWMQPPAPISSAAPVGAFPAPTLASPVAVPQPDWTVPARPNRSSPVLVVSDGRRVPLDRTVVVGRDPIGAAADGDVTRLVVADPTRQVSKTHLALGHSGTAAWVEDRHSTNGATLTSLDGSVVTLPPGQRVALQPGSRISLGPIEIVLAPAESLP